MGQLVHSTLVVRETEELRRAVAEEIKNAENAEVAKSTKNTKNKHNECNEVKRIENLWEKAKTHEVKV